MKLYFHPTADAGLIMTCCQARAVPKVSKLGTGSCTSQEWRMYQHTGDSGAPMGQDHRLSGCPSGRVDSRYGGKGPNPAGEDWVADDAIHQRQR